jgi:hypothetical protein
VADLNEMLPRGALDAPEATSLTVAVQTVGRPTATETGVQDTPVVVERLEIESDPAPELGACLSSPP